MSDWPAAGKVLGCTLNTARRNRIISCRKKDKRLGAAIQQIGHETRAVDGDLFSSVVHQIVGQQVRKAQGWASGGCSRPAPAPLTPVISCGGARAAKAGITYRAEYITDPALGR